MNNIRVIYMGTPLFSSVILQGLYDSGLNIVGVVTKIDQLVGRKQVLTMPSVKQKALELGLNVIQPKKIKEDYQNILDLKPDLIITCAYGQMIPQEVLDYPKYGCINIHASLLPKYRGGAPIQYAILNGDEETGVTIMQMVKKMDAGDIIKQRSLKILEDETCSELFERLSYLGKDLILDTLKPYLAGEITPVKQDESKVTFAYNITKEQEFISFKEDVNKVYNHIKALISAPIGYGMINNKKLKIHKASKLVKNHQYEPGTLVEFKDGNMVVACLNGFILVSEVQAEGKAKVKAKDFYNGMGRNLVGKIFD